MREGQGEGRPAICADRDPPNAECSLPCRCGCGDNRDLLTRPVCAKSWGVAEAKYAPGARMSLSTLLLPKRFAMHYLNAPFICLYRCGVAAFGLKSPLPPPARQGSP